MNPWQIAQQIKYELQNLLWPSYTTDAGASYTAGELVFGDDGVRVFAGQPTQEQTPEGFPWALVVVGDGTADPAHPDLISQRISVFCAVAVLGDPHGEFGVIGGTVAHLGESANRGILELDTVVRSALQAMSGVDGIRIQVSGSSYGSPTLLADGRALVMSSTELVAMATSQEFYAPAQNLVLSGSTWNWDGAHCSGRFDFVQYRMVEKAGSSPSLSPADGTIVYTGTNDTAIVSPQTNYTYTVFADYSTRGSSTQLKSSSPEVGSYRSVTA